ncbi:hypothetical protein [Achromobacter xylosoxidans]|uniref:hypothetical protein n=1 Tax=Alcaligenes xylosoxydans xylosoxydans TaxID=85698 RepID=UPI003CF5D24D
MNSPIKLPPMPNELWATLDADQEDRVYAYAEQAVREALASALDGSCLVPTEPTHAMLQALSGEWHSSKHEQARANYSAMLKAAPQASAPPKENNHAEGADQ